MKMTELQEALSKLRVGDRIVHGNDEIMCVPGGWIFYRTVFKEGGESYIPVAVTSTFVPRGPSSAPSDDKKKIISLLGD